MYVRIIFLVIEARRAAREAGLAHSDASGSNNGESGSEVGDGTGLLLSRRRKKRRSASRKRVYNATRRRTLTQEERLEEERAAQEAFDASLLRLQEVDKQFENLAGSGSAEIAEQLSLEWVDLASHLLDTFRTTKALFPSDGKKRYVGSKRLHIRKPKGTEQEAEENVDEQAAGIAERLHASLHDEEMEAGEGSDMVLEQDAFRGISFDDWAALAVRVSFKLFLDLCLRFSFFLMPALLSVCIHAYPSRREG